MFLIQAILFHFKPSETPKTIYVSLKVSTWRSAPVTSKQ